MSTLSLLVQRWTKVVGVVLVLGIIVAITLVEANMVNRVTVVVDGEPVEVRTVRTTVAGVLDQMGLAPRVSDGVTPALTETIADGARIEINTAFPVTVTTAESSYRVQTPGGTVASLLDKLGIELSDLDRVTPGLFHLVQPRDEIRVVRVNKSLVTETEPIAYEVLRWAEPNLEKGKTAILREGREGVRELVYEVTTEDGKEVDRVLVSNTVAQEPRNKIIGIGTKIVVRTLMTANGPIRYTDVLEMEATAYYPGPESTGVYADGITATGEVAGHGIVAVDPRVIPLGTRLFIPGYGVALAADVGGAIKGHRIDLCFDTYREAVHFGRRMLKVYVLE